MMVIKTIDITTMEEVKTSVLSLLKQDTEIILTENGHPVARVLPMAKQSRKLLSGLNKDMMKMHDDFDDPMPESFWLADE